MRWNALTGWLGLFLGLGAGCATEEAGRPGAACGPDGPACRQGLYCLEGACAEGVLVASRMGLAAPEIDLLFVVDNSGSMTGEQVQLARSFASLREVLDARFGAGRFQVGVITPGMESEACPSCTDIITASCLNETGEGGRLQDRVGRLVSWDDPWAEFSFEAAPACRVVDSSNAACFYDPEGGGLVGSGTALVGVQGCGYERGLAAVRAALSAPLASSANAGFLRRDAVLAVVVVTDEEDCGEVGDVTENLAGLGGSVCYAAARGEAPDGSRADPSGKPYGLTPVSAYYDFLMGLKAHRAGMVKFAAVVGVTDPAAPGATLIRYESAAPGAAPLPACQAVGCQDASCRAYPGTRYIELAELFGLGEHGFVDTICQEDFGQTLALVGRLASCPREVWLPEPLQAPDLLLVAVDGQALPRYSCADSAGLRACDPAQPAAACGQAACLESWSYRAPEAAPLAMSRGGEVRLSEHVNPCAVDGREVRLEVFRPTPAF
jgi:hypothetical protein